MVFYQRAPALHHEFVIIQIHNRQQDDTLRRLLQPQAVKFQNRSTATVQGEKK